MLSTVPPRNLRLTKCVFSALSRCSRADNRLRLDDEIFAHLSEVFPELVVEPYAGLRKLDEEGMKTPEGKEKWRNFTNACVSVFSITRVSSSNTK